MAWIRTLSLEDADAKVLEAMAEQRALYPPEYAQPVQELDQGLPGIVASHTLIPAGALSRLRHLRRARCRPSCRCSAGSTR